ncbi:hypothetical protein GCM10010869_59400 [Mesorhizobium tianshanense]|nr:hypothetical protein GCM10010869_59400 [Mesorhizobium tianshanense]
MRGGNLGIIRRDVSERPLAHIADMHLGSITNEGLGDNQAYPRPTGGDHDTLIHVVLRRLLFFSSRFAYADSELAYVSNVVPKM